MDEMNLLYKFNVTSAMESEMQKNVSEYFLEHGILQNEQNGYYLEKINCKIYREISIPDIGRRSDIIIKVSDRKIFNIECKLNNVEEVINQAIDHQYWADYSYICLHALTYIPIYQIKKMIENGIGLMLWQNDKEFNSEYRADRREALIDVFGASKSKIKNKNIRQKVIKILKQRDSITTALTHEQL